MKYALKPNTHILMEVSQEQCLPGPGTHLQGKTSADTEPCSTCGKPEFHGCLLKNNKKNTQQLLMISFSHLAEQGRKPEVLLDITYCWRSLTYLSKGRETHPPRKQTYCTYAQEVSLKIHLAQHPTSEKSPGLLLADYTTCFFQGILQTLKVLKAQKVRMSFRLTTKFAY